MKRWLLAIIVAAPAFLAGVVCAMLICRNRDPTYQAAYENSIEDNAVWSVRFNLANIDKAQRADDASIVRVNCVLVRSALRLIRPAYYENPQSQKEIEALLIRAKQTVAQLQTSGSCELVASHKGG